MIIQKIRYYLHDLKIFFQYECYHQYHSTRGSIIKLRTLWLKNRDELKKLDLTSVVMLFIFGLSYLAAKKQLSFIVILAPITLLLLYLIKEYSVGHHRGWERKRRYESYKKSHQLPKVIADQNSSNNQD